MVRLLQKFKSLFTSAKVEPLENSAMDDEYFEDISEEEYLAILFPDNDPKQASAGEVNIDDSDTESQIKQSFAKQYPLPETSITAELVSALKRMHYEAHSLKNEDDSSGMGNAMYFVAEKRMSVRPYNGDDKTYLLGLLSDLSEGKREFSQVCYDNDYANDVFRRLRLVLMQACSENKIENDCM